MKTLEQHNAERFAEHQEYQSGVHKPRPNGIECPKCGEGMVDTQPMVTLTSNPPMKAVSCPACGHKANRVA